MNKRHVIIMAGGRGERFWPQSRENTPKHLLPIVGEKPMLAQTLDRLAGLIPITNTWVLTNRKQRTAVLKICPILPPENVIGEPQGRDTAAAIGLALLLVQQRDPEASFAILPADQVISQKERFQSVLETCFQIAESQESLVTIGIQPTYPATGYGYIEKGKAVSNNSYYTVKRFVEKPILETAQSYLKAGNYFWNAGMFIWRASVLDDCFKEFIPALHHAFQKMSRLLRQGQHLDTVLESEYPKLETISIDYALMEKAKNVVCVLATFDWDDVGEWLSIARHFPQDAQNNTVSGEMVSKDAHHNIVVNQKGHLTALIGVQDLIVVQTEDATLVCARDRAQEIKDTVKKIASQYPHLT